MRVEIEGIVAGEADFDEAFAALHGIDASADEIAIIENVAGSGHQADVGERRLKHLRAAADGGEFEFAGALGADQRAARGLDDDVAGNFLEMNIAGNTFEFHVARDLLDVDHAGLGFELKFGFFRNGEL